MRRYEVRSAKVGIPGWETPDLAEAKLEAERMANVGRCRIVIREMSGTHLMALHVRTTVGTFTAFDL
jgi:hypothetical protein